MIDHVNLLALHRSRLIAGTHALWRG
jgi:hypothetical protein